MKEVDYNNKIVVKINEFYKDITIYKLKKCDDEESNTYSNCESSSLIDDLIIKDTIGLIDRIELVKCKTYLKELGIKGYSKLSAKEMREVLAKALKTQSNEYVLKVYNENKVRLDMFKYEVCEALDLSIYKFNKEKDRFVVSGIQSVHAGGKTQQCNKYCRRKIYEEMFR